MILTSDRYPEGNVEPGRAAEIPLRLGPDGGRRAAGTGNPGGDPDEEGWSRRRSVPHDAAFFIAQRIRSNVRELEGCAEAGDSPLALHGPADHHRADSPSR
ncbi:hypothetical protein ACPA9J_24585 [Pseudomonas aeruginosa]